MFVFAHRGLDFSEIRGSCMLISEKQLWVHGFRLGNRSLWKCRVINSEASSLWQIPWSHGSIGVARLPI